MTISADYTVNGASNPGAHVVTYGSTVNLAMLSVVGASVIEWSVVAASHTDISLPTVTAAGSPIGSTASFTFPADPGDGKGRAVRVKLRVSNERESAEQYTIVGVASSSGVVPFCTGEDFDRNATFGWTQDLNNAIATAAAGGSVTMGGDVTGNSATSTVVKGHLTDATAPSPPASGILVLQSFSQQGFSVPHVYDTQGNAIEITRDNITVVRNNSGGTINKGQVVYVTGSTGTVPTIALAKADSLTTLPAIGVMYETTSNNAFGRMMLLGNLENFDLSAFSTGNLLYVSATTAGSLTTTAPSFPNFAQTIGTVLNNGVGNGVLQVHPQNSVQAQSSRQPTASVASTFSTTAGNVDATVYTVTSSPAGNGRFVVDHIIVRLRTAIVGTGSVAVTVGATAGGVEYITSQTLTSASTVGVVAGVSLATLGTSFPSSNGYEAVLNPSDNIIVRWATTGTISAGAGDVYVFGKFLP